MTTNARILSLSAKVAVASLVGALAFIAAEPVKAQVATIGTQLSFGARGAEVTKLQSYLRTDATLYPEGLVTGYFGSLTQAAVQRFQCRNSIICSGTPATTGYGRVGPKTLARINAFILGGGGVSVPIPSLPAAPIITNVNVATTPNSATVTWMTNELARGTINYGTTPVLFGEGIPPSIVSQSMLAETGFGTTHSITAVALASSTTYFLVVQSVDAEGNLQLTWPTTFRTNP